MIALVVGVWSCKFMADVRQQSGRYTKMVRLGGKINTVCFIPTEISVATLHDSLICALAVGWHIISASQVK